MLHSRRLAVHVAIVFVLLAGLTGSIRPAPLVSAQVVTLGGDTEAPAVTVAQGVAALPNDDISWRVVRSDAAAREDQQPMATDRGFVLSGTDSLLMSDLDTSAQTRLDPGEAAWVAGGTQQQRASLGDGTVTYTEISLVAGDDAEKAGDGDLVFAGDAFNAPDGSRKISLREATLGAGQTVELDVVDGESVVFVASGMVTVSTGGDLATGDAQSYANDITLANESGDAARVLIGSIGAVVPPLPAFTGSATLQVRACPDGSSGSSFVPDTCTPVDESDGFTVGLLDASFNPVATDQPFTDGEQTWNDLEFGVYPWGAPTLPAPYVGTLWTDTDSVPLDIAQAEVTATTPDVTTILYVFPVTTGSITVTIANCPGGVTADTLANATCDEPVSTSSSVTLTTPDGETLDASDATAGGGTYQFAGLPVANGSGDLYIVDQPRLPNGYDSYLIVSGGSGDLDSPAGLALTSAGSVVDVTIFNFRPEQATSPQPIASASTTSAGSGDVTGSITLQVIGCPPDVQRGQSESYGQCTSLAGGASAVVVTPAGQTLTGGGAGGTYAFDGLDYGTYSLGLTGLPAGFSSAVAPGYGTSDASASRVNVSVSADNSDPVVTVYVFQ